MHKYKQLSTIVWVDKKPVLVIFAVTPPIQGAGKECLVVEWQMGHLRKIIETSFMHFQYTKFMREVDTTDQLGDEYSCQVRTHKWRYRFFFPLEITVVNM